MSLWKSRPTTRETTHETLAVPAISLPMPTRCVRRSTTRRNPSRSETTPQLLVDDWIVDNHFGIKYKSESVTRVFHPPVKHPANPLIAGDGGYPYVYHDAENDRFQMWYQTHRFDEAEKHQGRAKLLRDRLCGIEGRNSLGTTRTESVRLGRHRESQQHRFTRGRAEKRASAPLLLDIPEDRKQGFKYLFLLPDGWSRSGRERYPHRRIARRHPLGRKSLIICWRNCTAIRSTASSMTSSTTGI